MTTFKVCEPIYYMGWVIQLVPGSYYVYDRQDRTSRVGGRYFKRLEDAYRYVEEMSIKG